MATPTFAEAFCSQHGIPPEKYGNAVFWRTLYWRAIPFIWLLPLLNIDHFTADRDLIKSVGLLKQLRGFSVEAERFHQHPCNRGMIRWRFCMRISSNRLRSLIKATFLKAGIKSEELTESGGSRPSI